MKIIAIGDIHGCSRAFDALLEAIELQGEDRLITLGDYVDRGADSKGVLDRLVALSETGQLIPLLGNHELMMLEARTDAATEQLWRDCGGEATLQSYGKSGEAVSIADIPQHHWNFLEDRCFNWYETDGHFFVHANADPHLPFDRQLSDLLFWKRFGYPEPHFSGKTMVCGHSSQKSGLPLNVGHAICIDTYAWGGSWLTALEVTSGRVWQAKNTAQIRRSQIDDFLRV
ncbi:MAG: metallophosphoesterase family protein [Geitlerinemataceae cyanobacterium]